MRSYACCLSALRSGFVSRFGRARANDRFAVRATFVARSMFGSCRSPRATTSRARCAETAMWEGHCYLHGPSHQGSHPRLSPWLRPSANVSRLEAPFCCCFMARARATLNEQCQPSEGEALLKLVEQRRGVTNRTRYPSENHNSTLGAVLGRAGIREIDASHIKQPCCPHQRPPGTHCWCHKHRTPSKRSEKPAIVAIDRRKEPESITGEPIRGHAAPPDSKTRRHAAGEQTRRHAAHTGPVQR